MNKHQKIEKLISIAKLKMKDSNDPIHDLDHVTRVVAMVQNMGSEMNISEKHMSAIILAAWWHDVGRTITKRPSFIYMIFLDDIISSIMLWAYTIRYGLFGSIAGIASRIILCKSYGSGKLFTKLLTTKKTQLLVDMLEDADMIDVLHSARVQKIFPLVESSYKYKWGYKTLAWINFSTKTLDMRTEVAKKHLHKKIKTFLTWMEEAQTENWHTKIYGKKWSKEIQIKIRKTLQKHIPSKIKTENSVM